MDIPRHFEFLGFVRGLGASQVDGLDDAQLLAVPDGLSNNILWNLGHVLFYESVFIQGQSGAPSRVPESYGDLFKAGTSPADWEAPPDVGEVVERYKTQLNQTIGDFEDGKLDSFKLMKLNENMSLGTLEESLAFHCFHEGVHLGRIGTLKRLV